jgi:hypothetical protein
MLQGPTLGIQKGRTLESMFYAFGSILYGSAVLPPTLKE